MGEDKEKIRDKMLRSKYKEYKCIICGEPIRHYDIEKLDFEYLCNKRGEKYIHSRCKEK